MSGPYCSLAGVSQETLCNNAVRQNEREIPRREITDVTDQRHDQSKLGRTLIEAAEKSKRGVTWSRLVAGEQ